MLLDAPRDRWLVRPVVALLAFCASAGQGSSTAQQRPERASLGGHANVVSTVAITRDSKTLATGSRDQVKLWDLTTGKEIAVVHGNSPVAFSPDGMTLASGAGDDAVRLWDVATRREIATVPHGYRVHRAVFTPDGKTLITAGEGPVKLLDAATGKERATLKLVMDRDNANLVLGMALSADGQVLCTGHGDGSVKLWDLVSARERTLVPPSERKHSRAVPSAAFTADGKTLACGFDDGTVKLWDVATGKERVSVKAHTVRAWSVAFSPDGKTLASGGWDGKVKFWDATTGRERASFAAHDDRAYAVAFTADGKTLVSGGGLQFKRGEAKLWDVAAIITPDNSK